MSTSGQQGRSNDEMFLSRKNTTNESPVIEPLRIQKRSSAASNNMMSMGGQQPAAPSAGAGASFPMPALPQMPGLPYPDDAARQSQMQAQAARANGNASPYQYPDPRRVGSPQQQRKNSASPMDPAQRGTSAGSGKANYAAELPATSTQNLAERRGANVPKPLPDSPGPVAPDKESPGLFQRPVRRPTDLQQQQPPSSAPAGTTSFPQPTVGNAAQAAFARLNIRDPNKIGRIDSTASTSTLR